MTFSRVQKISLAFFICSLLPAYLIAHWRHAANQASTAEKFDKEHSLHISTDKLVINCERLEATEGQQFSANHQICNQGQQQHALTQSAMDALAEENSANDTRWYRNFLLSMVFFNLLGFVAYKARLVLNRDDV